MDKRYEESRFFNTYNIINSDGVVLNTIIADQDFMEKNYQETEFILVGPVRNRKKERAWRNFELSRTDDFVNLQDYPYLDILLQYRAELRDWPSSDSFPIERPKNLEQRISDYKQSLEEEKT